MKTGKISFVAIATLAMVTTTTCLDLRDVQEGSCGAIQDVTTLDDVDPAVLDRMFYVPAGSKYQLYRYARGHLHFDELRDYKFFYQACLFKNVSVEEGSGSTFGFGNQQLVTYDVRRANQNDETGVALVTRERPGPGIETGEKFTSRITLTDNENYAVVVHCWEDVNQKGWSLYSRQYTMDREMRKMVEDHVIGLGFDRDNVAFLEYTDCREDEDYDDGESLDLDFHLEGEGEAPPPTFENIERFSSIVTGKTSKPKDKEQPKNKSSSTKEEKSSEPKNKSSSGPKDKSSEKESKTSDSKKTSSHPNKSSSSKDKSEGSKTKSSSTPKEKASGSKDKSSSESKDKSSEKEANKSDSKKTSSHPDKSSSGSKDKSSESHKNKSDSKHPSNRHAEKSMKDEHSELKDEKDHEQTGKKDTKKSEKKSRGRSHSSTHHSSEEDSSEEKFAKGSRRFRSGGYRRFGNVGGGGWMR